MYLSLTKLLCLKVILICWMENLSGVALVFKISEHLLSLSHSKRGVKVHILRKIIIVHA